MPRRKRIKYDRINMAVLATPVGPVTAGVIHGAGTPALCALIFGSWQIDQPPAIKLLFKFKTGISASSTGLDPMLARTQQELDEFFACERTRFSLPILLKGTPMQEEVWRALLDVPHGQTTTSGDLAARIGRPDLARTIGQAVHANRIPIVIPCHRVLTAGGKLGGYSGGVEIKKSLLEVEQGVPLLATRKKVVGGAVGEGPRLRLVR